MKEPLKVRIAEMPDRYLVLDAETGDVIGDELGFNYRSDAHEWATAAGYEVESTP